MNNSFAIGQKSGVLAILISVALLVGIGIATLEFPYEQWLADVPGTQSVKSSQVSINEQGLLREVLEKQNVSPYPDTQFFNSVGVLTNEQIRTRIVEETSGLTEALSQKNDIKIVRLLRTWAAENFDLNYRGTSYWDKLYSGDQTLANMLYLFDHNLLGVHCADGSRFLAMIFHLFGYHDTFLYNSRVYFEVLISYI